MNPATTNTSPTTVAGPTSLTLNDAYFARRNLFDWVFAALVTTGALFAFVRYAAFMDVYEKAILIGTIPAAIWIGWFWRPLRGLMVGVAACALLAIYLYQGVDGGSLANAEVVFLLK